jgi:hypothetical protein
MNRHIALCVLATVTLVAGCTTNRPTRGIATPWGAAALHSFRSYQGVGQPDPHHVEIQVTKILNAVEAAEARGKYALRFVEDEATRSAGDLNERRSRMGSHL